MRLVESFSAKHLHQSERLELSELAQVPQVRFDATRVPHAMHLGRWAGSGADGLGRGCGLWREPVRADIEQQESEVDASYPHHPYKYTLSLIGGMSVH